MAAIKVGQSAAELRGRAGEHVPRADTGKFVSRESVKVLKNVTERELKNAKTDEELVQEQKIANDRLADAAQNSGRLAFVLEKMRQDISKPGQQKDFSQAGKAESFAKGAGPAALSAGLAFGATGSPLAAAAAAGAGKLLSSGVGFGLGKLRERKAARQGSIIQAKETLKGESATDKLDTVVEKLDEQIDIDKSQEKAEIKRDRNEQRIAKEEASEKRRSLSPEKILGKRKGKKFLPFLKGKKGGGAGGGSSRASGSGGGKMGGMIGKFFGKLAPGPALAGFITALGQPHVLKAAVIFAGVLPLIGVALGGFIATFGKIASFGLDALAETFPPFVTGLKKFEDLDGQKLSLVGNGLEAFFDGLPGLSGMMVTIPDGLDDLADSLIKMNDVNAEKLKIIGPAVEEMGKGLMAAGLGEVFSSIASALGGEGGGIEGQMTSLANGFRQFKDINADDVAKIGPAVKNLGEGLKAAAESDGFGNALGGIIKGIGSFFGAGKEDPIEMFKRFAVLGQGEVGSQLEAAGQFLAGLGQGLSALNNLDTDTLGDFADNILPPLTKLTKAFDSEVFMLQGDPMGSLVGGLAKLKDLEGLNGNAIKTNLEGIGEGLEEFADYLNDGEIETLAQYARDVAGPILALTGRGAAGGGGTGGTTQSNTENRERMRENTGAESKSTPKSKIQKQAKAEYQKAFEEGAIATKALEEFKTEAGGPDITRREIGDGQPGEAIDVKGYKDPEKQKEFDRLKSAVFKSKKGQKRAGAKYAAAEGVTDTYKFGQDRNRRNDMRSNVMKIKALLKRGYSIEQLQTFSPKAIKQMESGKGIITIGETRFPMQALGLYEEVVKKELQPNLQPPTVAPLTQDIATQSPAPPAPPGEPMRVRAPAPAAPGEPMRVSAPAPAAPGEPMRAGAPPASEWAQSLLRPWSFKPVLEEDARRLARQEGARPLGGLGEMFSADDFDEGTPLTKSLVPGSPETKVKRAAATDSLSTGNAALARAAPTSPSVVDASQRTNNQTTVNSTTNQAPVIPGIDPSTASMLSREYFR